MPLILDISSDEEDAGLPNINDFDWIKDLLTSDEESDDSDEVVIIHENKPDLKSKSSTLPVKAVVGDDDDDDDDCVVLEGDPEKGVASVVEEATESDDLLVVGEKGQIACRDYPHARHLCAKFPFSSTPHERHCSQCHCYVCDSPAPCLKWGTGILSADHCHANDKTELWKIQRKNFKLDKSSPLPASTNYATSLCARRPQCNLPLGIVHLSPNSVLQNQASRSTAMRTSPLMNSMVQIQASRPTIARVISPSLNSHVQNQVSRPNNINVVSTATNLTLPTGANYGNCRESRSTLVRNRYQPQSVQRQVLGVRSPAIHRERGNGASSLRTHPFRPRMISKGVGAGKTLTVNNFSHGSSGFNNSVNATQQNDKYHTAAGFSNYRNCNGQGDVSHRINLPVYSHPSAEPASLSCVDQLTVASETQTCSQPLPQPKHSQNFHHAGIQSNDAPSSYAASLNSYQHGNECQIISQNENASGNITQGSQPKPPEESPSVTGGKFSAFDSSWTGNTSQSIEPLIERSPLQSSGFIEQPLNAKESGTQFTGSIEPLNESSHLTASLADFENWLLDKDSFPVVTNEALQSALNIPSPDFDPVDMGMVLFYIDGVEGVQGD